MRNRHNISVIGATCQDSGQQITSQWRASKKHVKSTEFCTPGAKLSVIIWLIDQICQNGSSHPIISCELKSSSYSLSSNTGHNEESDHANGSDETSQKSSAGKLAELSSLSSSSAATDNEPYQYAGTHPSGQNHNKTAIIKEAFKQIKDKPLG